MAIDSVELPQLGGRLPKTAKDKTKHLKLLKTAHETSNKRLKTITTRTLGFSHKCPWRHGQTVFHNLIFA